MNTIYTRFSVITLALAFVFAASLTLNITAQQAPAAGGLLAPYNQLEFEAGKREKAVAATEEYQAKERELKANTALPGAERNKQTRENYNNYLKKMDGLLSKEQREKAHTLLVENDVKGLRQKPQMPRYYDQLGLSAEQTTKAQELFLQQRIKERQLYHNPSFYTDERNEEQKVITQEFNKKFNDLLTPDQRTNLVEVRKQGEIIAKIPVPPLYQKLGLNQTQTDKLKQVLYDRQSKLGVLQADAALSAEQRQQQANAINQEADKNAQAILTREQRIKLSDLISEANYQMPPLYAQLNLSEEQQAKLKETILWQGHEAAMIRTDTKLTPEQRQEKMAQMNQSLQERFTAFLTPEQMTKLTTILRERQQQAKPPQQ